MRRVDQRERVFKLIFEDSINKIQDIAEVLSNHDLKDDDFIKKSIVSYNENYEDIDNMIRKELKKRYSRLNRVEKAILFLSLNEIYHMDIPVSVSINEAVELSKKYSDEEDYKIINSILGNIIRANDK